MLTRVFLLFCFCFLFLNPYPLDAHSEDGSTVIHMHDKTYEPSEVTILQGETVIFENVSTKARWPASNIHPTHTVYPGSDIKDCWSEEEKVMFDACRGLAPGESFRFTFTKVGSWRFHDHLDSTIVGEITVEENPTFVGESEERETSTVTLLKDWVDNVYLALKRWFYFLFPGLLEKRFDDVSVFEIVESEEQLSELLLLSSPSRVMNRLLEEADGGYTIDCHDEAHVIGRRAFELYGAEVFEQGDPSCHSGFYHGAMESFLSSEGTDNLSEKITALCEQFDTTFGIFECLHGVGHGVMAYEDYALITSLEQCEELNSDFAIRSCYSGVFMENVVAGQGNAAIEGHETTWVNEEDYHFPCNAVGDDYNRQYECYQMQTSWMLTLSGYDFRKVVPECLNVPKHLQQACFMSIGRDAAGQTLRNPEKILEICELTETEENYRQCMTGGLNVIIDFWGPKLENQADDFCNTISSPTMQESCFGTIEMRRVQLI